MSEPPRGTPGPPPGPPPGQAPGQAMGRPSLWQRLWAWLRGQHPAAGRLAGAASAPLGLPAPAEPARLDEELWLEGLIADVAEGKRVDAVGGEAFWMRIDNLWTHDHERLATEWLAKFVAVATIPPDTAQRLQARLVELLDQRNDLAAAVPHLERLTAIEAHATRAHYLLGEHFRRQGNEGRALRHYEAVLARDMAYPNVRERVERLRLARGRSAPAMQGETITGADGMVTTGAARYGLVRELGRGATGVVYLARDQELERDVAVKLLHPHLAAASRAQACARFFEEARICASLRHPNIMAVLDMDEDARRIVMELGAGGTLRQVLRERGPRPLRQALGRHAQILSALEASHRRGIVHCDVKPANLMFRRDPDAPGAEIMLGDFGVAHLPDARGATGAQAAESKRPLEAVGTLAYMSPEQRRGADADPRSDLYAAAVVLFEMLTGAPPWPRDVLLAGTRRRGDFRLPAGVTITGTAGAMAETAEAGARDRDPALLADLNEHLERLGDPHPTARPDTATALIEARALRDRAIAVSAAPHP